MTDGVSAWYRTITQYLIEVCYKHKYVCLAILGLSGIFSTLSKSQAARLEPTASVNELLQHN